MRPIVRLLSAVAVLAFTAGLPWAYAARDAADPTAPVALLAVGTAATLFATALYTWQEVRPGGLTLPEDAGRLPAPAWWAPVGVAGLVDLAAGSLVSVPVAVLGLVLTCVALIELGRRLQREPGELNRATVRAAREIQAFGARHAVGGDASVEGVIEHVARGGTRIVLVGRDGEFGDQFLATPEQAVRAAELAGMTVHEKFPAELVGRMRTGPYEWKRMAGMQLGGPANPRAAA